MDLRLLLVPVAAGVLLAAMPASADTREEELAGIQRCQAMRDDRTWLDCLYGAQQPMRARLGLPPAPEFQQRLVPPSASAAPAPPVPSGPPPARAVARKKPSFFDTLLGSAPPAAKSRMQSYRYEKSGAFVVTLENGQEWQQADVEAGSVQWLKPPSSYLVTVTPDAFGSFSLRTDDAMRSYKVKRIR